MLITTFSRPNSQLINAPSPCSPVGIPSVASASNGLPSVVIPTRFLVLSYATDSTANRSDGAKTNPSVSPTLSPPHLLSPAYALTTYGTTKHSQQNKKREKNNKRPSAKALKTAAVVIQFQFFTQ